MRLQSSWRGKYNRDGNIAGRLFGATCFVADMIYSFNQYKISVENLHLMSKTLGKLSVVPLRDDEGNMKCRMGNSTVLFEVMYRGEHSALRVYLQPHHNLRAIYGNGYFPNELMVHSGPMEYGMAGVVLCKWYEGETLQSRIERCVLNPEKISILSKMFEAFALSLLNKRWAHGDLKPENIIITKRGLRLIDFDAMYCEGFTADDCVEIGTAQYQHPSRDKSTFDKSIDDYPIALITTLLAALAIDTSLGRELLRGNDTLIDPCLAIEDKDEMLTYIERLFAEKGDARHYCIAKMLHSKHQSLPHLKSLLEMKPQPVHESSELLSECHNGRWGYVCNGEFVIPPYYDLAFDFSEGLGMVRIADVWHFIDTSGRVVITCGRGNGLKPFRNGVTRMRREDGTDVCIFRDGRVEVKERRVCMQKI